MNMLKRNCDQVARLLVGRRVQKLDELACLYHLLNGFTKKQLKKTYQDFNSVIALGQFVTLGVVLVGILARVYAIYGKLLEIYESQFREVGFIRVRNERPKETNQFMESLIDEELGEAVPSVTIKAVPLEPATAKTRVSSAEGVRSKKKNSKKKKSAIDSIFG